jgi:beta-phosphoglucomutase
MKAVLFDLDGVIVSTDEFHYRAWKALAERGGIEFSRKDNDRLRGVNRAESLEIILEKAHRAYSAEEKAAMAEEKNGIYRELLQSLSPKDILPGIPAALDLLKGAGVKTAIASSSRNAAYILEKISLCGAFDAVVDGTRITRSKPDPEVFLLAARELGICPEDCVVVEDADAGVAAAVSAGMRAVAVGAACGNPAAYRSSEDTTGLGAILGDLLPD